MMYGEPTEAQQILAEAILAESGRPATYIPRAGAPFPLQAIFAAPHAQVDVLGHVSNSSSPMALVLKSALLDAGAGGQIVVAGYRWKVQDIQPDGAGLVKLVLGDPVAP